MKSGPIVGRFLPGSSDAERAGWRDIIRRAQRHTERKPCHNVSKPMGNGHTRCIVNASRPGRRTAMPWRLFCRSEGC